jgi:hypothetical protein
VWAAWLWNTSATSGVAYHLGRARLDGATVPEVISFDHLGEFSQFAISDAGELTLLYGIAPNRLRVYRATERALTLTGDYDLRAILNTP